MIRRERKLGMLAVPAVFMSVYALTLITIIVLQTPRFYPRFLASLYVPALMVVVLVLNELLRYVSKGRPLGRLPPLRSWNASLAEWMTVSAPALVLTIVLSPWLSQQAVANYYDNIREPLSTLIRAPESTATL